MNYYELITTRVSEDTYRHRVFVRGKEINLARVGKEAREAFFLMAEGDAKYLHITKTDRAKTVGPLVEIVTNNNKIETK